jgi:Flp pilus assembly secretin CpaC
MAGSLRLSLAAAAGWALMAVSAAPAQESATATAPPAASAPRPSPADSARPRIIVADGGALVASAARPGADNAGAETVTVMIDHAKVVRLPERSHTVIVGNPMIADITIQRNGIAVVTGKAYGVTNLIALDPSGAMLAESLISVQAATESILVVQRGLERESYSCTPKCQPSILLGDSNKYFSEVGGQAGQRNGLATQR